MVRLSLIQGSGYLQGATRGRFASLCKILKVVLVLTVVRPDDSTLQSNPKPDKGENVHLLLSAHPLGGGKP